MKIRTGFVTNSSSTLTAEIIIDNPILLEILNRYKEMGVFGELDGDDDFVFEIGSREASDNPLLKEFSATPAFYYKDEEAAQTIHPRTLDEVVETIIEFLDIAGDAYFYDQELFSKMKEELFSRKEEIMNSYERISWFGAIFSHGTEQLEEGDENYWQFEYDPENGERNVVEYYDPKKDPLLDSAET